MTTLQITPNWKNKTAKFKGTIAAGEHVAVSIANDDSFIADTTNLRLRVVNPANGKTLAQFPMPEEDGEDGEAEVLPSSETPAEGEVDWASDLTPLYGILNLNTDRMLMAVPPAANVQLMFVLDDYEGKTLYFKDMCEVTHWPRRVGEEEPTNLDDYADIIADFREDIYGEGGFEDRLDAAEAAVSTAVTETIPNALGQIDDKVATAVATSLSGKVDKIPGKGLSKNDYTDADREKLAGIAAGAKVNVQSDWNQGDTSADDFIKNKPTALKNPAALTFGGKTYDGSVAKEITAEDLGALTSHQDISGKADKSDLSPLFDNVAYDGTNKKILFKHGLTTVKELDATAFIKDGMVSSVAISSGNLVITFNTDAGQSPISIPLTDIFNPANYYDKTTADGKFVAQVSGAGTTINLEVEDDVYTLLRAVAEHLGYTVLPAPASSGDEEDEGEGE